MNAALSTGTSRLQTSYSVVIVDVFLLSTSDSRNVTLIRLPGSQCLAAAKLISGEPSRLPASTPTTTLTCPDAMIFGRFISRCWISLMKSWSGASKEIIPSPKSRTSRQSASKHQKKSYGLGLLKTSLTWKKFLITLRCSITLIVPITI